MTGTVGILNVGAGDTKLTFDKSNPAECIRAARIVKDMLRRGYALLIEVKVGRKTTTRRVYDFDEAHCEYRHLPGALRYLPEEAGGGDRARGNPGHPAPARADAGAQTQSGSGGGD